MVPEVVDSLVDFDELEEDYDYPESDLECFMRQKNISICYS